MKYRFITSRSPAFISLAFMVAMLSQSAGAEGPQDKVRLAVFPFITKDVSSDQGAAIRDQLSQSLEQTERFSILGDVAMQSILADLGLTKLDDCQTPACLSLIGSRLGVRQVLHGSLEHQDSTTTLFVKLVDVDNGKVLFSRTIDQLTDTNLFSLAQSLAATTIEQESSWRWYHVAGAVLVAGATIYLLSKGLGGDKGRQIEDNPNPPPPPGN